MYGVEESPVKALTQGKNIVFIVRRCCSSLLLYWITRRETRGKCQFGVGALLVPIIEL